VSEQYGFGYYDGEPGEAPAAAEQTPEQGPKWFRDYMGKVSKQLEDIKAENTALKAEKQRTEVAQKLTQAGYAPQAAGLYQGDPAGLDDWLKTNGPALAKLAPEGEQVTAEAEQQAPPGPAPTIVSPESQAAHARMQAMGAEGSAAPAGSDQELAAQIDAMSEEQFSEFMRTQGNRFF
jgi:hypothetical protein